MKVYLLGGFDYRSGAVSPVDRRCVADAVRKSVYVLDVTSNDRAKIEAYRPMLEEYFLNVGATTAAFLSLSKGREEIEQRFEHSGIIYVPGGDTRVLIENLETLHLAALLKRASCSVAGNSAGAIALCTDAILTIDDDVKATTVLPGVGLVDFSVDPHYGSSHDEELLPLSRGRVIYGLPEQSAIIYDGSVECVGPVWRFADGKKARAN
ncbi:MAG TPA: type 1 glutamine amidotransferase-like domain-containing protein [Candidatus Hydrogenedentes bacterium]|nr:type 1 glutamine amidotransferase-like domain-containing protein [Candidatus Hydrogenedentota bacterium]HIJ73496.1 type 1 glutamine amidotransferase-like domain-containing protein [Candidatus Hydrogenedentota bacterium]